MSSKKDFITQSYTSPLVLVPDTHIQRVPFFKHKKYPAPCPVSDRVFGALSQIMMAVAVKAHFDYIAQPLYQVFDNELFCNQRRVFWKPLLKRQFPIYVVSSLFGIIWPSDYIGLYDLPMEEMFLEWRKKQLWRFTLELFEKNNCDCVLSYLPALYDNVVRVEETPWFIFEPEDLLKHRQVLLALAKNRVKSRGNIANSQKPPETNTFPHGKTKAR